MFLSKNEIRAGLASGRVVVDPLSDCAQQVDEHPITFGPETNSAELPSMTLTCANRKLNRLSPSRPHGEQTSGQTLAPTTTSGEQPNGGWRSRQPMMPLLRSRRNGPRSRDMLWVFRPATKKLWPALVFLACCVLALAPNTGCRSNKPPEAPASLSSGVWANLRPTGDLPPVREGHALVYEPATKKVILFGGIGNEARFYDDTWAYDPSTNRWTNLDPTGEVPLARDNCAVAHDPINGKIVLFGGWNGTTLFNDTWAYDPVANTWRTTTLVNRPSARFRHCMVYEPTTRRVLLFGGTDGGTELNDTWAYDPGTGAWDKLCPEGRLPHARASHSMVYDPTRGKVILFGGLADHTHLCDTWSYDPLANKWSELDPAGDPPPGTMVYDSAQHKIVMFGWNSTLNPTIQVWAYDPSDVSWKRLDPTGDPPPAFRYPVYDSSGQVVISSDGNSIDDDFNRTWVYGAEELVSSSMLHVFIPPEPPSRGLFPILTIGGSGYIDRSGKVVIEPQFPGTAMYFSYDRALVCAGDDGWGFVDPTGKMVIPPSTRYFFTSFQEGLALFKDNRTDRWGFMDVAGSVVLQPQYRDACWFSGGLAAVETSKGWFFVDHNGTPLNSVAFLAARSFSEGLAPVKDAGSSKWGYIDYSARFVIAPAFDDAFSFSDGRACVKVGKETGYIDMKGALVFYSPGESMSDFSDGRVAVEFNNKWAYLDTEGRQITGFEFDSAYEYQEGLAAVEIGKKWGYIDKSGAFVIKPSWDYADSFHEGRACVSGGYHDANTEPYQAVINTIGRVVWQGPYE